MTSLFMLGLGFLFGVLLVYVYPRWVVGDPLLPPVNRKQFGPRTCRCENCGSKALVSEGDLTSPIQRPMSGDYVAQWTCPACGKDSREFITYWTFIRLTETP